ncbi:hypothetical protein [Undibacterium parvum]|uniref:DUF4148 domain-containing protein n=1 Tax=Undibacterium parvum TaxID=401471 RepID=A0A3S9HNU5_9BURK|nr:hypothetical protein [Undibacterium parvum]AZP13792.1 hypothetical protein EJN92_18435 [Undibacterium parvum]
MKSTQKLSISLLLSSALLSIACISATAHTNNIQYQPKQASALSTSVQTIEIRAHAWTSEQKIAYDSELFGLAQQPIPSVLITAKRLSSEEKIALDKASARNLHANLEFNKMLKKTA